MIDFGSRLKKLRLHNNMTQMELATMLGLTKSVISAYEKGIRFPSYDSLICISRTFEVSTDFLLGIESNIQFDFSGLSKNEINALVKLVEAMRKDA